MTVRDLVQTLLLTAPNLDAKVYIQKQKDEVEVQDFEIQLIDNWGSNDGVFIDIVDYGA